MAAVVFSRTNRACVIEVGPHVRLETVEVPGHERD